MPTPISDESSTTRRPRGQRRFEMPSAHTIPHGEIARRAYELFLSRGAVHGHDVEHWLEAENDLKRMRNNES
jgi:hypothetical protein